MIRKNDRAFFYVLEAKMKTVINGVYYDTAQARPLATIAFAVHGVTAEESAYQMPDGHCFLVRRIGGKETSCWRSRHKTCAAGSSSARTIPPIFGWVRTRSDHVHILFLPLLSRRLGAFSP